MKDKYIQAIILGVLIGGAILLDDFVGPKDEQKMEKGSYHFRKDA